MHSHMNIAFFGSSLVSSYWNGAATYYRGIIRALHERGFRTTFYEPDALDRQAHRDMNDPDWANVVVYPATESGLAKALDLTTNADVIIKASGVGIFDDRLEAAVTELRSPSTYVVFWDVDAPATLARLRKNPDDPFRELIQRYDLILTYGGGPAIVAGYRALGASDCVPIYNALDPDTHYPVEPDRRFAADLGFLGNRLPDRESRVRSFFFETALRCPNDRFLLGGSGWSDAMARPPNVEVLGHVSTRDHNVFNSSVGMVLNVNRDSMAQTGWSPPTRVFEAAGAGACLIVDAWDGIESFLQPEREVLVADNGEAVASYLKSVTPRQARSIGKRARKRLLAEHTYRHRAAEVERLLHAGLPTMAAA